MKTILLSLLFIFGFLFSQDAAAQRPKCCKHKKVKMSKARKRSGGELTGAASYKKQKAKMRKEKKAAKQESKMAEKAAVSEPLSEPVEDAEELIEPVESD